MRILGVAVAVALVAVGCGAVVPSSPDAIVNDAIGIGTIGTSATATSKPARARLPEPTCAVLAVALAVENSSDYKLAYRIEAAYKMAGGDCAPPIWSLPGRNGEIIATTNPYVVHVRSFGQGVALAITATAPNGVSASRDLKF